MDQEKTEEYEVKDIFEELRFELPDIILDLLCNEHKK
ncbi:hypothetical protein SAMN05518670_6238 [Paenibacillus sp. OK076]|nr:hypothetical protein SAMN05518670_6238 [Paenibacillus sp. OK076]